MKNKIPSLGQILADMTKNNPRIDAFWKVYFRANWERKVTPFMVEYGERLLAKESRAVQFLRNSPPSRNLLIGSLENDQA